jgi:hypothetical protein
LNVFKRTKVFYSTTIFFAIVLDSGFFLQWFFEKRRTGKLGGIEGGIWAFKKFIF